MRACRRTAVKASAEAGKRQKIAVGVAEATSRSRRWSAADAPDAQPRADAEAWSVMLYTSGTTAKPKGVPRRQRAERAAALAHVAQNLYRNGERTLGVMPLYHTMGVRSLLAMSLIGGAFVCLPRFDVARALELIEAEKITNLYLVPTLYHDLVHHERFKRTDVSSVRKIGFAGASMTDGLLKELQAAFSARAVRQSLRLVGNLHLHHRPERAEQARLGRPRRHQPDGARGAARRVVARRDRQARRGRRDHRAAAGRRILRGLLAAARGRRQGAAPGLVLHRRHRRVRRRRRPVRDRPGRRHDHHRRRECLAGRDRKLPVAARGGVRGRRGRACPTSAGARSSPPSSSGAPRSSTSISTSTAATSGLANFKRPRRYVFVETIPKSPVGKLLRRLLVAGEYEPERTTAPRSQGTAA